MKPEPKPNKNLSRNQHAILLLLSKSKREISPGELNQGSLSALFRRGLVVENKMSGNVVIHKNGVDMLADYSNTEWAWRSDTSLPPSKGVLAFLSKTTLRVKGNAA